MTNQFELFGGNQMVPTIVNTSSHQIESNNNCIRSQTCISDSALYHICMEPTLLKLDMDDFINTLEHEYYTCQENGENLQMMTTTCATSPSKIPSPTTPKFKCKWANTLSNSSTLPETEFQSFAEQNSLQSSSNATNMTTSNSSNTSSRNKEITKKPKSKTKIQKKRNYQQVFHTIPPRNSCSEKKTGSWKFHLMDAEEEEDQSNYKFHIYSGNNSNQSNRSNNSNNSK